MLTESRGHFYHPGWEFQFYLLNLLNGWLLMVVLQWFVFTNKLMKEPVYIFPDGRNFVNDIYLMDNLQFGPSSNKHLCLANLKSAKDLTCMNYIL